MNEKSSDSVGDAIYLSELKMMLMSQGPVIAAVKAAFLRMFPAEVKSTIKDIIKEEIKNWTPPPGGI